MLKDDPAPRRNKTSPLPMPSAFVDMPCWTCMRPEPRKGAVRAEEVSADTGGVESTVYDGGG
jgi:hypothetical protein